VPLKNNFLSSRGDQKASSDVSAGQRGHVCKRASGARDEGGAKGANSWQFGGQTMDPEPRAARRLEPAEVNQRASAGASATPARSRGAQDERRIRRAGSSPPHHLSPLLH
jgi:hypothetical protein